MDYYHIEPDYYFMMSKMQIQQLHPQYTHFEYTTFNLIPKFLISYLLQVS